MTGSQMLPHIPLVSERIKISTIRREKSSTLAVSITTSPATCVRRSLDLDQIYTTLEVEEALSADSDDPTVAAPTATASRR